MGTFIVDSFNPKKVAGCKLAVEKYAHYSCDITSINLGIEDVRPLSEQEIYYAMDARQKALLPLLPKKWEKAILLQKGIVPDQESRNVYLTYGIQIMVNNGEDTEVLIGEKVLLDPRIYTLVFKEGIEIYKAYDIVYGKLASTESLYERVTGKSEIEWLADGIEKTLRHAESQLAMIA